MTIIVKINMVTTTICSLRVLVRIFGRQTLRISAKTLFTEIHVKLFVYMSYIHSHTPHAQRKEEGLRYYTGHFQNNFGKAMSPDPFPAQRFGKGSCYARLYYTTGVTVKSVRVHFGPGGPFLLSDLVPSRRIRPPLQSVQLMNWMYKENN